MNKVDNIIIGFGKGGKTLASYLAKKGEKTILIEKDPNMYGGTCINVGCIPSKKLVDLAKKKSQDADDKEYYKNSILEKKKFIKKLNDANFHKVDDLENADVITGVGRFIDNKTVEVVTDEKNFKYQAENIFINTGATPNIPDIEGLKISDNILTSKELLDLENLPERLVILGDGAIGLEFASIYQQFGSKVTILSRSCRDSFLDKYDKDIADEVFDVLTEMGINFEFNFDTKRVSSDDVVMIYSEDKEIEADKLLVAVGRKANIEGLGLENTDIELTDRNAIKVDDYLQTSVKGVYAIGDVNGGQQQTFISLDDFRIIKKNIENENKVKLSNRQIYPRTIFLNPPLATVGMNEKEARKNNLDYKVNSLKVESIPKAKILNATKGIFKVIVDNSSDKILGATLFGVESHELINLITFAINNDISYKVLRDQIYSHPSINECFNDLFDF